MLLFCSPAEYHIPSMEKNGFYLGDVAQPKLSDDETKKLINDGRSWNAKYDKIETPEERLLNAIFGNSAEKKPPLEQTDCYYYADSKKVYYAMSPPPDSYEYIARTPLVTGAQGSLSKTYHGSCTENIALKSKKLMEDISVGNLHLAQEAAKVYHEQHPHLPFDDLLQEACLALHQAIHFFQPFSEKVSFTKYATACINGKLEKYQKAENKFYDSSKISHQESTVLCEQNHLTNHNHAALLGQLTLAVIASFASTERIINSDELDVVVKRFNVMEDWNISNSKESIAHSIGTTTYKVAKLLASAQQKLTAHLEDASYL